MYGLRHTAPDSNTYTTHIHTWVCVSKSPNQTKITKPHSSSAVFYMSIAQKMATVLCKTKTLTLLLTVLHHSHSTSSSSVNIVSKSNIAQTQPLLTSSHSSPSPPLLLPGQLQKLPICSCFSPCTPRSILWIVIFLKQYLDRHSSTHNPPESSNFTWNNSPSPHPGLLDPSLSASHPLSDVLHSSL